MLIAAITSCTNTSNPSVMLAAGLLAKKAVEAGPEGEAAREDLPGARLARRHRIPGEGRSAAHLDQLGFNLVAYGCTTCIGNSGALRPRSRRHLQNDLVCAAVLSGNRNFEARMHPNLKANFLISPPLVVAFALAGRVTMT